MYICPDPACKSPFEWKGAALDHLDLAHNIGIEPNERWASMSPSDFQRLLDETWKKRPRPSSQDEPSPALDLQPSASLPIADDPAPDDTDPGPVPDEEIHEEPASFQPGGGEFGGAGSSGDFSDAPTSEASDSSVDSASSDSGSSGDL